ncbi:MAG: zinc-dependent alcohol dehydrogenase family protein [Verrucomicrobiota bacterium]
MKAMVLREFGGPDVFEEKAIPKPTASPGQVLVKVAASSVNPVDYKIRSGALEVIAPESPTILGCDVSGLVMSVGEGVTEFSEGDEVYGCAGGVKGCPGALAEFMACDADLIAKRPSSLALDDCAALPLVTITAWDGLMDRAKVCAGSKVLVHGATGGVGHIALQLAKMVGAEAFVTGSSEDKLALAKSLGADVGINYRDMEVAEYVEQLTGGAGFDVVYDSVGGDNVAKCFEAAAVEGTVISISTRCEADLSPLHAKGLSLFVTFMLIPMLYNRGRERHGEILKKTAEAVDAGKLKPLIHSEKFGFTEVSKAHALLESGGALGKIVLVNDWAV